MRAHKCIELSIERLLFIGNLANTYSIKCYCPNLCKKRTGYQNQVKNLLVQKVLIRKNTDIFLLHLDVRINKPFKDEIRSFYLLWLERRVEKSQSEDIEAPNADDILYWAYKSLKTIRVSQVIKNWEVYEKKLDLYFLIRKDRDGLLSPCDDK